MGCYTPHYARKIRFWSQGSQREVRFALITPSPDPTNSSAMNGIIPDTINVCLFDEEVFILQTKHLALISFESSMLQLTYGSQPNIQDRIQNVFMMFQIVAF